MEIPKKIEIVKKWITDNSVKSEDLKGGAEHLAKEHCKGLETEKAIKAYLEKNIKHTKKTAPKVLTPAAPVA